MPRARTQLELRNQGERREGQTATAQRRGGAHLQHEAKERPAQRPHRVEIGTGLATLEGLRRHIARPDDHACGARLCDERRRRQQVEVAGPELGRAGERHWRASAGR